MEQYTEELKTLQAQMDNPFYVDQPMLFFVNHFS
jgi:hypothetical protein